VKNVREILIRIGYKNICKFVKDKKQERHQKTSFPKNNKRQNNKRRLPVMQVKSKIILRITLELIKRNYSKKVRH
jgi:hypothetical protein